MQKNRFVSTDGGHKKNKAAVCGEHSCLILSSNRVCRVGVDCIKKQQQRERGLPVERSAVTHSEALGRPTSPLSLSPLILFDLSFSTFNSVPYMEKQATFFWNARRSVTIVALLRRWVVCNRANSRLSFFLLLLLRSFCYIVIVIPFAESAHMYFLFYHLLSYSLFGAGFLIFLLTEREADEGSFHPFKKKLNTVFFRDVVFFFFPKKNSPDSSHIQRKTRRVRYWSFFLYLRNGFCTMRCKSSCSQRLYYDRTDGVKRRGLHLNA